MRVLATTIVLTTALSSLLLPSCLLTVMHCHSLLLVCVSTILDGPLRVILAVRRDPPFVRTLNRPNEPHIPRNRGGLVGDRHGPQKCLKLRRSCTSIIYILPICPSPCFHQPCSCPTYLPNSQSELSACLHSVQLARTTACL